jgi:protein TonB
MFEDAIFESAGRIHTHSRQWMIAAFAFNATILLAFVAIPLLFPTALPQQFASILLTAPVTQPKPLPVAQTAPPKTQELVDPYQAPQLIPTHIYVPEVQEPPIDTSVLRPGSGLTNDANQPFSGPGMNPIVRPVLPDRIRVSTSVEQGLLIRKIMPVYPVIAKATGTSGTVTLAAIISKTGTIENLHVISGPMMLQQAALDAVRTWLYRPYLLDGQPVEVETTVNVIFTLQR